MLLSVLTKLERTLGAPPYNWVIHGAPFNDGPLDHYHWHMEIMPRVTMTAGFEWGSGFYINPVLPEEATRYLVGESDRDAVTRGGKPSDAAPAVPYRAAMKTPIATISVFLAVILGNAAAQGALGARRPPRIPSRPRRSPPTKRPPTRRSTRSSRRSRRWIAAISRSSSRGRGPRSTELRIDQLTIPQIEKLTKAGVATSRRSRRASSSRSGSIRPRKPRPPTAPSPRRSARSSSRAPMGSRPKRRWRNM